MRHILESNTQKDPCGINGEHLDKLIDMFFSRSGSSNYIHNHSSGMKMAINDFRIPISDLFEIKNIAETSCLSLEKNPSQFPNYEVWHKHFIDYIFYVRDIIEIKKEQKLFYSKLND